LARAHDFGGSEISRGESGADERHDCLRCLRLFPKLAAMNDATNWKVPKLPFLTVNALLLAFAYFIVWKSPHPISLSEAIMCITATAVGAIVGVIPFILDYRAMGKIIEANALGAVSDKIQNLEKVAAQITSASNQWAFVQESVQAEATKTAATAKQISDKMTDEVRQFSEFMQKMNDSEKATLRLEVEKLHRGETEWLQVLVRILDHVFSLHVAAVRSGEAKFSEPITHFQNACRGTARRLGLTPFVAEPDEPFNAERHQVAGGQEKPPEGALVTETVGSGYTFQGKLLRPALVRVRDAKAATPVIKAAPAVSPAAEDLADELPL
jgi:molecular chaperone GrpE (heat shock protein)